MKLKGLTIEQLRNAVDTANAEYDGNIRFKREPEQIGNFLHFTLTVNDSRKSGGRLSHSGRRVSALCWHGHRDVMRQIFAIDPEAVLVTALARYEGLEGFMREYPATGNTNIGSMFEPLPMNQACEC